jgi:hypothetical protein
LCGEGVGCILQVRADRRSSAHEHHRTRPHLSPILTRASDPERLGLAPVSALRRDAHLPMGELHPAALDAGGTAGLPSPAAPMCAVPAHLRRTYSEESPWLIRGGWYAREVRRCAVDVWQHGGTSLRRTAELIRSWVGRQERWLLWRPLASASPERGACHLSASTVERWLDGVGQRAGETLQDQWVGVPSSGHVLTDGLWTRLRGGAKRVVVLLTDSVSGVIWPPVVVAAETSAASWATLFDRGAAAGLAVEELWSVTSDGATGLAT